MSSVADAFGRHGRRTIISRHSTGALSDSGPEKGSWTAFAAVATLGCLDTEGSSSSPAAF
jgi:hypothetical protein